MQEDTTTTPPTGQSDGGSESQSAEHLAQHCYYEVGAELLAKPGLLCDLIESEGSPKTLIFCNAPSDADFVDVILKKRGISARKLIGHVPHHKVARCMADLDEGLVTALVLTDVSAETISRANAKLVINHSVPTDPDSYLDRISKITNPRELKVVSFVGPLDFSNFHYLKKVVENEFVKLEPPSYEEVAKRKVVALAESSKTAPYLADEKVKLFVGLINNPAVLSNEQREVVLAALVNGYLNPAPPQQGASQMPDSDRGPRRERQGGYQRDRGGDDSDQGSEGGFEGESGGYNANRRSDRGERRGPAPKDCRLYIGHGSRDGYSQADFNTALKEALEGSSVEYSESLIKRFTQRELYCFADLAEEVTEIGLPKLKESNFKSDKLVICNAVVVPVQRAPSEDDAGGNAGEFNRGGDDRRGDRGGRRDHRENRGNRRSFDDAEDDHRGSRRGGHFSGDDEE